MEKGSLMPVNIQDSPSMPPKMRDGRLVTFYSYKGGVGRTMALANVACHLANRQGFDVIIVDWDLEAPGLHYYFGLKDDDLIGKPGLLDYLEDFAQEVEKGAEGSPPNIDDYLQDLPDDLKKKVRYGSVRLMTCGDMGRNYMSRVQDFDWGKFYRDQEGYMIVETLKQDLRQRCDIALIDARAGQADVGTISTIQIPDAVVLLFTSNRQNLHGTADMAQQLKNHPDRRRQGQPDPKLLLVPSRVFSREERFDRWMKEEAEPVYKDLLKKGVVNGMDQPRGLAACVLPVDSRYTFGENLPMLTHSGASDLKEGYQTLAETIGDFCAGRSLWFMHRLLDAGEGAQAIDSLREELTKAAERGDAHGTAMANYMLGANLVLYGRHSEAEANLSAALAHFGGQEDQARVAAITLMLGRVYAGLGRLDEALQYCERARTLAADIESEQLTANAWGEIADILQRRGELDEALRIYREEELPVYDRLGDVRSRAVTMGQVADILQQQGQTEEALRIRREEELPVYDHLGDVRSRAVTMGQIADILQQQGQTEEAMRIYRDELLPVFDRLGDVRERTVTMGKIADILTQQGQTGEAMRIYRDELLPIYDRLGDVRSRAVTMGQIADILQQQGQTEEAMRIRREEELPVYDRLGDVRSRAFTMGKIADILQQQGQTGEAMRIYCEDVLPVADKLTDQDLRASTLWSIARIHLARKAFAEARPYITEAYDIVVRLGRLDGICAIGVTHAEQLLLAGRKAEGLTVLRRSAEGFDKLGQPEQAETCRKIISEIEAAGKVTEHGDG